MMKVLKILKVLIILKRFSFKRRAVVLMLKNYGFTLTFRQFHGKLNWDHSFSEKSQTFRHKVQLDQTATVAQKRVLAFMLTTSFILVVAAVIVNHDRAIIRATCHKESFIVLYHRKRERDGSHYNLLCLTEQGDTAATPPHIALL